MRRRIASLWGVCLLSLGWAGCDGSGERLAGGNVATEAGNAVSARLVAANGMPAVGAVVVVRPSSAVDSTSRADWVRAVADSHGVARFRLKGDHSWTLEAKLDTQGIRMELPGSSLGEVSDTLQRRSRLEGVLMAVDSGAVVVLPGLARSTVVGSGGAFRFDSLPQGGVTVVRQVNGPSWTLAEPLPASVVLSEPRERLRLAWWAAATDTMPMVGSGLVFDSGVESGSETSAGAFREAPLGGALANLQAPTLASAGAFSLALRIRLTSPAIGSIWLVDFTDSAFAPGLRIGVGGGKIRIQLSGVDTSFASPTPVGWETWVVGHDGNCLVVWSGGLERLRLDAPGLADRATWTHRILGSGGGMRVGSILVWDRMVDGLAVSARQQVRGF